MTGRGFETLTDDDLNEPEGGWKIRIEVDKDEKILRVIDNGIGMTADEVETNIGTIASSGTKAFLKSLADQDNKDRPELIGQFGVGFYSSFMVADRVEIDTLRANQDDAGAVFWMSTGDGSYQLGESNRDTPGTRITLHLKAECEEFLEEWKIREIVRKFSDFVAFPITMDIERTTPGEEGEEPTTEIEEQTLNSMKAIWTRPRNEVSEGEYCEFYKSVSRDWTDPARTIHYVAEGTLEFRALVYLPAKRPMDMMFGEENRGLHLYAKRVFIMNNCEELLPLYLRFVRGVVDSSDLSLNVSREILQENVIVRKIQTNLVSKILSELKSMQEKEADAYLDWYRELGSVLKEGVHSDHVNREKIEKLMMFESSTTEPGQMTSLTDYVNRMHPDQKEIYFITGEDRATVAQSPHLEAFASRGFEVLFLTDPIDEWVVQSVTTFDDKPLKAVHQGEVDLDSEEQKEEKKAAREENERKFEPLLKQLQSNLEKHVKEVRLSDRLTESACCLVAEDHGMNANMERILASMGQNIPETKRILELNPSHPVLERMHVELEAGEEDRVSDYGQLLFGQALLAEGSPVHDPARFSKLVSQLMVGEVS